MKNCEKTVKNSKNGEQRCEQWKMAENSGKLQFCSEKQGKNGEKRWRMVKNSEKLFWKMMKNGETTAKNTAKAVKNDQQNGDKWWRTVNNDEIFNNSILLRVLLC